MSPNTLIFRRDEIDFFISLIKSKTIKAKKLFLRKGDIYPTPDTFGKQPVKPEKAFYSNEMGEFFLTYEEVINADDPEKYLMEFLQSTYEAAAVTGNWAREALETDLSGFKKTMVTLKNVI